MDKVKSTTIVIGGEKWQMVINGDQGVLLSKNYPTEVQFLDCGPGETPDDVYNSLLGLEETA